MRERGGEIERMRERVAGPSQNPANNAFTSRDMAFYDNNLHLTAISNSSESIVTYNYGF